MNKLPSKIQFFNKNMANKDNVCPIKSIRDDMAGCCRASNIKFIIFKYFNILNFFLLNIKF